MNRLSKYRKIGIVGGMAPESTSALYELIIEKHINRHSNYEFPDIIIYSVNFAKMIELQESGDMATYVSELSQAVSSLERAGTELVTIASNTPHMVIDKLRSLSGVPIVSIPDIVAERADKLNMRSVLLLGTKFTMRSDFYQKAFLPHGIKVIVPNDADIETLNSIIYDDLSVGDFKNSAKQSILDIMNNYPCDGIILGCTELPLIIDSEDSSCPLLDTLDIQAESVLNIASKT